MRKISPPLWDVNGLILGTIRRVELGKHVHDMLDYTLCRVLDTAQRHLDDRVHRQRNLTSPLHRRRSFSPAR